jgi:hypothetical protein
MSLNVLGMIVSLSVKIASVYFAPKTSGVARLLLYAVILLTTATFLMLLAGVHTS